MIKKLSTIVILSILLGFSVTRANTLKQLEATEKALVNCGIENEQLLESLNKCKLGKEDTLFFVPLNTWRGVLIGIVIGVVI